MPEAVDHLQHHVVPLEWLLILLGVMLTGILFYVRERFKQNEDDHKAIADRIDHIILHHQPRIPPYGSKEVKDE